MKTLNDPEPASPGSPARQNGDKDSSQKKYKSLPLKKQKNNIHSCPFLCPHCNTLGPEYLRSRYEQLCIISDSGDSIYSPMHERYYDENKGSVREGRVFIAADVVEDLLRKFKK